MAPEGISQRRERRGETADEVAGAGTAGTSVAVEKHWQSITRSASFSEMFGAGRRPVGSLSRRLGIGDVRAGCRQALKEGPVVGGTSLDKKRRMLPCSNPA